MDVGYVFERGELRPPGNSKEVLAFAAMLRHPSARELLERFGISLPGTFEFVEHTNPDAPPDISALGYGFEVTTFPPDQLAREAVIRQQTGQQVRRIPPFQIAGRNPAKIREEMENPDSSTNDPYRIATRSSEVDALAGDFLSLIDTKDVDGNDILLLDHRCDPNTDRTLEAVKRVTTNKPPKHIKLIVIVGTKELDQAYLQSRCPGKDCCERP